MLYTGMTIPFMRVMHRSPNVAESDGATKNIRTVDVSRLETLK